MKSSSDVVSTSIVPRRSLPCEAAELSKKMVGEDVLRVWKTELLSLAKKSAFG